MMQFRTLPQIGMLEYWKDGFGLIFHDIKHYRKAWKNKEPFSHFIAFNIAIDGQFSWIC